MQSLQMRWPVPGHIGLSMHDDAPARRSRRRALRSMCISEIFSSSGQPASSMPSGLTGDRARPCRAAPSSTSPCRARGRARSSGSRSAPRAAFMRASVSLKPSRRRSRASGPSIASGSSGARPLDLHEIASSRASPGNRKIDPVAVGRDRAGARRTSASARRSRAATSALSSSVPSARSGGLAIEQRASGRGNRAARDRGRAHGATSASTTASSSGVERARARRP